MVPTATEVAETPVTAGNANTSASDLQDDHHRLIVGTQAGTLWEISIPSGRVDPISFVHDHSITALLSNDNFGSSATVAAAVERFQSLYITGCKDAKVRLFHADTHQLLHTLEGHDKPVTSLAWAGGRGIDSLENNHPANYNQHHNYNYLLTGSWDGTAKIWDLHRRVCVATLPDHENSVCVAGIETIPEDGIATTASDATAVLLRVATGSAGVVQNQSNIQGYTVRIWLIHVRTGQITLQHAIPPPDHDGPIRDISLFWSLSWSSSKQQHQQQQQHGHLLTCSNDGTVKVRSTDTGRSMATLMVLPGAATETNTHPPMLLSVVGWSPDVRTTTGSTLDVTMDGNDGSAIVDCDYCHSNNETDVPYLATCAEDGTVAIWDIPHWATDNHYLSDMAPPSILDHPTTIWNVHPLPNGDLAVCGDDATFYVYTRNKQRYAPEAERQVWRSELERLQQNKSGGGPTPEEIAKLPHWYNQMQIKGSSEGQVHLFQKDGVAIAAQWSAMSQTWIEVGQVTGSRNDTINGVSYDHVLPIEIEQPSTTAGAGNVRQLQIGHNNGDNPFVTAQRFIDEHMLPQHYLSQIADYIQQRTGSAATSSRPIGTNSSATTMIPVATTGIPIVSFEFLPARTYKLFDLSDTTVLPKMKNKLLELVPSFSGYPSAAIHELDSLIEVLAATNRYHASQISDQQLQLLDTVLEQNPHAFPIMDFARLTILHPNAAGFDSMQRSKRVEFWARFIVKAMRLPTADSNPTAIPMLTLRLIANAFQNQSTQAAVMMHLPAVLAYTINCCTTSSNKAVRLSWITVWYNIAVYCHAQPDAMVAFDSTIWLPMMSMARDVLNGSSTYEPEAVLRLLIALGSFIIAQRAAKEAAQSFYLASLVERAASPHTAACKAAAKEVYAVLMTA